MWKNALRLKALAAISMMIIAFPAHPVSADEDPIKCTPCLQSPPPPPPPSCPPPPPPPKKSAADCPPPPFSPEDMLGPPTGNLYPVDQELGGAAGNIPSALTWWLSALLVVALFINVF